MTEFTFSAPSLGLGRRLVFDGCVKALSLLPPFTMARVSTRVLRGAGLRMGKSSAFWAMPTFSGALSPLEGLELGEAVGLNAGCHFELFEKVTLEADVSVGHDVLFLTRRRTARNQGESLPIRVGRGAWIGARATILPGVTIGEGAVIGAQVVVRDDVPPHTMLTGNRKLSIAKWR